MPVPLKPLPDAFIATCRRAGWSEEQIKRVNGIPNDPRFTWDPKPRNPEPRDPKPPTADVSQTAKSPDAQTIEQALLVRKNTSWAKDLTRGIELDELHTKSTQFNVLAAVDSAPDNEEWLLAGGRTWVLEHHMMAEEDIHSLDYICVSYTWGSDRITGPFLPEQQISNRTPAVLDTVARLRPDCQRIWIDALCLPLHPTNRQKSLESMGYIYSQAREVIAVLSQSTGSVLEAITREGGLEPEYVEELEQDPWVTRAWTYQEAINARSLFITYENAETCIFPADEFLNHVGHAIARLKIHMAAELRIHNQDQYMDPNSKEMKAYISESLPTFGPRYHEKLTVKTRNGLAARLKNLPTNFDHNSAEATAIVRAAHPRLDLIEDLCDYLIAGYGERSALQVLAMMSKRDYTTIEEYFYGMIGAVTQERASDAESDQPMEAFMRLCERKTDFSFIFSIEQKNQPLSPFARPPYYTWRPKVREGVLSPVLPLQVHGSGQPGYVEEDGRLTLHGVTRFVKDIDIGPLNDEALKMIENWLGVKLNPEPKRIKIARRKRMKPIYPLLGDPDHVKRGDPYWSLKALGFEGCKEPLRFQQGLVYTACPYFKIQPIRYFKSCLISTTLRYTFGAPAIICYQFPDPSRDRKPRKAFTYKELSKEKKPNGYSDKKYKAKRKQQSHMTYLAGIFIGPTKHFEPGEFTIG